METARLTMVVVRRLAVVLALLVAGARAWGTTAAEEHSCELCVDGDATTTSAACPFVVRPLPEEKKKSKRRCYTVEDTRPRKRRGVQAFFLGQPWYVYVLSLWVLSAFQKYFD